MNKDVTEKLGGLQLVITGVIEPGDHVTFPYNGERDIAPVEAAGEMLYGMPVEVARQLEMAVYRKIQVAHQGDIDHAHPPCSHEMWIPDGKEGWQKASEASQKPIAFGVGSAQESFIPQDSAERKQSPMHRGLLGYFPAALFEIARHSMEGEKKHNPGATDGPTWSRGKSTDHADCIVRHLIDAGDVNTPDRLEHLRALAWRSCALLQEECERLGAKPGISSRYG